jgi:hypothetical protein
VVESALSMPRYFFHVRDASSLARDTEGSLLEDYTAAILEARASVREFAIEALKQNEAVDLLEVEIHDEHGVKLGVVRFADVAGGNHSLR